MRLLTIGFTKKSAERFFTLLRDHGVTCLVDTRLHPGGQLAGFARGDDLPYLTRELAHCDYLPLPILAPPDALLRAYRQDRDGVVADRWDRYARGYLAALRERQIPAQLDRDWFATQAACLLCSEAEPDHCHRRLAAEHIAAVWGDVTIEHLQ